MRSRYFQVLMIALVLVSCKPRQNSVETTTTSGDSSKKETGIKDIFNKGGSASSTSGWSMSDRDEFITGCLKEYSVSRTQCTCMQEAIEKKYPDVKDAAKISESELKDYKIDCDTDNGSGSGSSASTWTDAERRTFVETCTNSAAALGDRAKPYCECSLEKLERIYPNSADVSKLTTEQTETIAKECLRN